MAPNRTGNKKIKLTKIAESCSSILGIAAACLLAIATASTCSVALADDTPIAPLPVCS